MPVYMDRHNIEGVTAKAVAEAHEKDLETQDKYGVKYVKYWCDEARGKVFCLVEAPSKEKAEQVHREAHGLVANEVIEVEPAIVEAFLGTIEEPPPPTQLPAAASETPVDTAFRAILFTDMKDSTAITRKLGDAKAVELLRAHNTIIREALTTHGGSEVKHTGDGFMASFASVSKAVMCAIAILKAFDTYNKQNPGAPIHLRIGLSAGEPVAENKDLFGATVQLAARLCAHAKPNGILVSNVIRELCIGKKLPFRDQRTKALKGFDRPVHLYAVEWQKA